MKTPQQNAVLITVTSSEYNRLVVAIGDKYRHLITEVENATGWYYQAEVKVALTYILENGTGTLLAIEPLFYGFVHIPAFFPFTVIDHGSGRIRLMQLDVDTLKACGVCPALATGLQRPAVTPVDVLERVIGFIEQPQRNAA